MKIAKAEAIPLSIPFSSGDPRAGWQGQAWRGLDCDVLVLAAGSGAVERSDAARLSARLVVEGANLPTSRAARELLADRGIAVIPDVVANLGGATVTGLFLSGEVPRAMDTDALVSWIRAEVRRRIRAGVAKYAERAIRMVRSSK